MMICKCLLPSMSSSISATSQLYDRGLIKCYEMTLASRKKGYQTMSSPGVRRSNIVAGRKHWPQTG